MVHSASDEDPARRAGDGPVVYSFGYSGQDWQRFVEAVVAADAVVIDTRIQPSSRTPTWNKSRLQAALKLRYVHAGALGNKNYRSETAPPDSG